MDNILNIEALSIGYNKNVLIKNINLSASNNELVSIIGRNGEGKSTLIKSIVGFLEKIHGNILINNKQLESYSEKEKSKLISVVLTEKIALHNISVFDYVAYGRYPYTNWLGMNTNSDNDMISKAINICGIKHLNDHLFSELSDGEKQKTNIARAIAQNTPIIVLDEPTAHLDLVNKLEVFKLLNKLVKEENKTIIISTHQIELALQLSDKIWMINNKNVIEGSPEKLKQEGIINQLFNSSEIIFNTETNSFTIK